MKKTLSIVFLMMSIFLSFAQNSVSCHVNRDQTIYWMDSVYLTNYSIVYSGINGQRFIVPDSTYKVGDRNQKLWNNPDVILYTEDLNSILIHSNLPVDTIMKRVDWSKVWPYDYLPENYFYVEGEDKDMVCRLRLPNKPTFFRVFRIRGDVYNKLSVAIDSDRKPIKFKHPKEFYTVYCPIR